jgi:hypothetical protein
VFITFRRSARVTLRAEALFLSDLDQCRPVRVGELSRAVRRVRRQFHSRRRLAGEFAARYAEQQETAVPRMRWALEISRAGVRWS